MIKIRGLIIPDEDKKYVSELSKVNPFTYKNIDFRDRIPLNMFLFQLLPGTDIFITSIINTFSYLGQFKCTLVLSV